jgi:hypothetical protein
VEAAISLLRRFMIDLGLRPRHAQKRVPEAGARIPQDDDANAFKPFLAEEDQDGRAALFAAARRFAVGDDERLEGVLLEFLATRVEWAHYTRGLRAPAVWGAFGGISSAERVKHWGQPAPR